ncbi:hypothetical protein L1085_007385 [Streptomyces sp. MSC1_001]|jgi:hypothetical protein|uniref:hypothetical protein n=1 Tax=Streptomyces sp. MSC1_001 TaxID=2909263 RepID=UPI0020304523|nr:hypothetical protein [Streptomyces sp. MSC1_001]
MKKRHVRAIAVFGIAVFALTGARGSGGGGCDNHSSSGSSSSSNSNHGSDNDSTSGGTSGGSSSADKAARDVTIDECKYDPATKNLVARVTVKNDGAMDYDYNVTMKFTGAAGGSVVPATAIKTGIAVAAGSSAQAELSTPYPGTGDGSEYTKCEVSRASRF